MERKIGEIFYFKDKKIIVEKGCMCDKCVVFQSDNIPFCLDMNDIGGECQGIYRSDNTTIIFREVK